MDEKEEMVEIILINDKTDEPYPGDNIFISMSEYDLMLSMAQNEKISVDEMFVKILREGMKLVTEKLNSDVIKAL